jgi:glycosyltransferase involved in cell wall biosynthesis
MDAKLSIITPSLNQGPFIERTIRSVLEQGYPNLEYVIVDGGSTDETLDIVRRYEDRLAWWISEPDLGQSDAVNKGIQGTSGDIVAYLNSDDYYLPGTLELVARAFEESKAGWIAGASIDVEEGDPGLLTRFWAPVPPSHCEGDPPGRHHWMLVPWHVPQPSVFWRREMFERFGLLRADMHYAFDAEFMLRLAYGGEFPERLPDQVLSVRGVHPGQKTYDMTNSWPEIRRFKKIFRPRLTLRERIRLRLPARPSLRWLRFRLLHPLLRLGGDALEYVPERVRPPIRTRDRRPRVRSRPAPKPRRFPASPVGITEIRERSPIPGIGRGPVR